MDDRRAEEAGGAGIDRRAFFRATTLAALSAAAAPGGAWARAEPPKPAGGSAFPGLITREAPDNLEFPFPTLEHFLTPTEQFYVRCHFAVPRLDASAWRLKVEGAVERPLELTYDALRQMPARSQVALLECSGNSRVFVVPKVSGVAWELGAVSNAEWTGVPLAAVLERAGLRDKAVEVVLEGADEGEIKSEPSTPGKVHFARSLPLAKARQAEVLLAYRMNGDELPARHGFPVRAVIPGWYGMASVKWLRRIIVTDRPYRGYFQTLQYGYFERRDGLPTLTPVTEIQVKSQIARPARNEVVPANSSYRVFGAAWTGESEVAKVMVSTDGGKTWAEAKLLEKPTRYAWRFWEYVWRTPSRAGRHVLMARATDERGRAQPLERDPDRRNTMISHVLPTEIEIR